MKDSHGPEKGRGRNGPATRGTGATVGGAAKSRSSKARGVRPSFLGGGMPIYGNLVDIFFPTDLFLPVPIASVGGVFPNGGRRWKVARVCKQGAPGDLGGQATADRSIVSAAR